MPEKDNIYKGKIKQAGLFSFKDLYSFAYDYLLEEDYDLTEKSYTEKITGDSKQIELRWDAVKKVSDYFKFQIKMDWQILGMKEVEVEREGKKIKTNSGSIEIKFSAYLIKDHEARWEENAFFKFLRGVYDRFIIRQRVDKYEQKLIGETLDIINQCKSFLVIEGRP
jgi:hypothetical protein